MPGIDGTGPMGNGPFGRGMGPCGNGQVAQGRGCGFGRRNRSGGNPILTSFTPDEARGYLEQQKERLVAQLEKINKKLQE